MASELSRSIGKFATLSTLVQLDGEHKDALDTECLVMQCVVESSPNGLKGSRVKSGEADSTENWMQCNLLPLMCRHWCSQISCQRLSFGRPLRIFQESESALQCQIQRPITDYRQECMPGLEGRNTFG